MFNFTYCEQKDFLFTTQPLNTISSVAFLLAAFFLYRFLRVHALRWKHSAPLVVLCGLICFGSILWHSMQTQWSLAADILPIFIFMFAFQHAFLRRFTRWSRGRVLLDMAGLAAAMGLASLVMNDIFLQKSNAFVPVVFWLIYAGTSIVQRYPRQARSLFLAAPVFALAILMRIVDVPLCHVAPTGTHFLWHGLSALTLYLAMTAFHPVSPRRRI